MRDERHIDFLGRGWAFPVSPGPPGDVQSAQDEEKIRQSIWIILATAPGERVMRPDFGCGIHRFVFALNDATTVTNAVEAVKAALVRWEPRIDLLDVGANARRGNQLLINIRYRVRTTNNLFNLVYPFYLGGALD
jgi:phage baseplate assembly protein W